MHALAREAIELYPSNITALVHHIADSLAVTHPSYAINTAMSDPSEWVFNK